MPSETHAVSLSDCTPIVSDNAAVFVAVQSRLPGFVSAGVIQQNQDDDQPGKARAAQPSMAANPEEMELDEEAEDEAAAAQVRSRLIMTIRAALMVKGPVCQGWSYALTAARSCFCACQVACIV